jgi:hypothetical protein
MHAYARAAAILLDKHNANPFEGLAHRSIPDAGKWSCAPTRGDGPSSTASDGRVITVGRIFENSRSFTPLTLS